MKFFYCILILFMATSFSVSAKVCRKGQPCGNSCISWNKTCRIGTGSSVYSSSGSSYKANGETKSAGSYKSKQQNHLSQDLVGRWMYVSPLTLNVRSADSTGAKKIAELKRNDVVYVENVRNGWAKISKSSGIRVTGWVKASYLSHSISSFQ